MPRIARIFIIIIFLFLSINVLAIDSTDSHFGLSSAQPRYIQVFANAGVKWARLGNVAWGLIEPEPPKGGKHHYEWHKIDEKVKKMQDAGVYLQVILKSASSWGTKFRAKRERGRDIKSALPTEEYRESYKAFIYNIVERYDGDGKDDMPGLKIPIKYWQIESEVHNKPLWAGTADEYLDMLEMAYASVKKADPSAKVILAEFNFSSFFDRIKSDNELKNMIAKAERVPRYTAIIDFVRTLLKGRDSFDIIGFHANTNYTGIIWTVKWLRTEMSRLGYEKPIWIGDAVSGPLLEQGPFKTEAQIRKGRQILSILDDKTHPRYEEVEDWYRHEQAKLTFKKMITAVGSGVERIFINNPIDWTDYWIPSYRHFGLLDRNGNPRPAFYTYKLVLEKLDGFNKVERLNPDEDVYIYRFEVNNRILYACWKEGGEETIKLKINGRHITIIEVVPENNNSFKSEERKIEDTLSVTLSDIPKIIEIKN